MNKVRLKRVTYQVVTVVKNIPQLLGLYIMLNISTKNTTCFNKESLLLDNNGFNQRAVIKHYYWRILCKSYNSAQTNTWTTVGY